MSKLLSKEKIVEIALYAVEQVLPIYEYSNPGEYISDALKEVKEWLNNHNYKINDSTYLHTIIAAGEACTHSSSHVASATSLLVNLTIFKRELLNECFFHVLSHCMKAANDPEELSKQIINYVMDLESDV